MKPVSKREKPSQVLASAKSDVIPEFFAGIVAQAAAIAMPRFYAVYVTKPATEAGALVVYNQHLEHGDDTGQHRHEDFFSLYLVQSGRGVHLINGHAYGVARGDVYITPPGTTHAYRDFDELRTVAFCFQAAFFQREEMEALRALPGFWDFLYATEDGSRRSSHQEESRDYRLHLSPEMHRAAEGIVEDIKAEVAVLQEVDAGLSEIESDKRAASRVLIRQLFFRLLVQLARWRKDTSSGIKHNPTTSEYSRDAPGREMAALLQFCEENFDQPLSVPQLAARVFLSTARFTDVFAHHIGCPPATYLRRLRLERAQALLRETSLTINEIARRCGYSSAVQLSRAFRTAFDQTPSEYRALNRSKE